MNYSMFKNISNLFFKNFILILIFTPWNTFSSEYESLSEKDFLLEIEKNSVEYYNYDSPKNQVDKFFGFSKNPTSDEQINYEDLSLTIDSKNIRRMFHQKMDQMTNQTEKTNKYMHPFYTDKL